MLSPVHGFISHDDLLAPLLRFSCPAVVSSDDIDATGTFRRFNVDDHANSTNAFVADFTYVTKGEQSSPWLRGTDLPTAMDTSLVIQLSKEANTPCHFLVLSFFPSVFHSPKTLVGFR